MSRHVPGSETSLPECERRHLSASAQEPREPRRRAPMVPSAGIYRGRILCPSAVSELREPRDSDASYVPILRLGAGAEAERLARTRGRGQHLSRDRGGALGSQRDCLSSRAAYQERERARHSSSLGCTFCTAYWPAAEQGLSSGAECPQGSFAESAVQSRARHNLSAHASHSGVAGRAADFADKASRRSRRASLRRFTVSIAVSAAGWIYICATQRAAY